MSTVSAVNASLVTEKTCVTNSPGAACCGDERTLVVTSLHTPVETQNKRQTDANNVSHVRDPVVITQIRLGKHRTAYKDRHMIDM